MPLWFIGLIAAVSLISGTAASVVGFGIGSLLTPVIALRFGTESAIAAVALPHFVGGLLRGWRLRRSVDWRIIARFGVLSAMAGLVGALVFARLAPIVLDRILGVLLVVTAIAGIVRRPERWTPRGALVWVVGALSGFFGGVVGNQGGLRAAALSAFGLEPTVFVATSTLIGVMIDLVRTPVYLSASADRLASMWPVIALAVVGVSAGTLAGERLLPGLTRERFRVVVSIAVGLLGLWFLFRPG